MSEFNIDELLKQINELEAELKSTKKYGLVWDKESEKEEVVLKCEKEIPILIADSNKNIIRGELNNVLIEGDNFHSLTCLNYVYKGQIDFIYIDPPYNTGKDSLDRGFVYNDKRVDENDSYKHSKWLNFMSSRLKLAHDLLSNDGTIFISIDDHEASELKLLCDQIFGPGHFITMIPRISKPQRASQEQYMDVSHDYILAYSKAEDFNHITDREYDESKVKVDAIGHYIPGDTKAILADKSKGYSAGGDYDFEYNGKIYKPVDKNGYRNRWLWTKPRMEAAAKLGILVETKTSLRMQLYLDKKFDDKTNTMVDKDTRLLFHTSDFMTDNSYSNANGVNDLQNISEEINRKFNNPKPVALIKKLISFCQNKECIVLDFFAGSGTTGQAVLELNKEDGGKRRFILCTNNENNICTDVTYPRTKTVITGKRIDGSKYSDGIASNLYYFKTGFIDDGANVEQAKYSLVEKVDSLLCISENIFSEVERNDYSCHYTDGNRHLFIYNDYYNETKFSEFKSRVEKTGGERIVYIFSSENEIDSNLIGGKNMIVKPIPAKIYEIYKEIVETIKRG